MSLRTRILLVVLGALLPVAALGLWVLGTAERSAEELLRNRLEQSMTELTSTVGTSWVRHRSSLLDLAETAHVRAALLDGERFGAGDGATDAGAASDAPAASDAAALPSAVEAAWERLAGAVTEVELLDATGEPRGTLTGRTGDLPEGGAAFAVRVPVHDGPLGERIGTLEARLAVSALLADAPWWARVGGSVLEVFDARTGSPLLAAPLEPELFLRDSFSWEGQGWAAVHRVLREPPLVLALAAPTAASVEPFRQTARQGMLALLAALVAAVLLATLVSRRITRPLHELGTAADAVSRGDLDRRAPESGPDEIRRLARAFNEMTESLQRTLGQLARQEALAAVGEFAASLAHEIRNPLTSVRLDLQRALRRLKAEEEEEAAVEGAATDRAGRPTTDTAGNLLRQALEELDDLEGTVATALRLARSGRVRLEPLDLRDPLRAAARQVRSEFSARDIKLHIPDLPEPVPVEGDAGGLEQLFRNLLMNAAEAAAPGGEVRVRVEPVTEGIRVSVEDDGPGIPEAARERVFEPLFSTREGGTGLGLPIARRIAHAHRTDLVLESEAGEGTAVSVTLARPDRNDP